MANTMTKVEKINAIAKAIEGMTFDGFDAQEFLAHEIEMTNKRNARKSNAPSKTQKENAEIKVRIIEYLKTVESATASIVAKALDLTSPQKASALLNQLYKAHEIDKDKEGKNTVFLITDDKADEE